MRRGESIRRGLSLAFIATFSLLVFSYLWWGKFTYHHQLWQSLSYGGGILLALLSHLMFSDRRQELGLRLDNLGPALRLFAPPTLGIVALLSIAGLIWGKISPWDLEDVGVYFWWAFFQQYLLQNFLRMRFSGLFHGRARDSLAAMAAGLLFGLYHLPNLPLVFLTFVGGLFWCLLYNRTANLVVAGCSHALIGLFLMLFFQSSLASLEIGWSGHRYDYYGGGVLVAGGYLEDGEPFVATLPGHARGVEARVRIFTPRGRLIDEWIAFPGLGYSGTIATGNLLPEPGDEVVVSPGPGWGNPSAIRIFSPQGKLHREIRIPEWPQFGAWCSVSCGKIWAAPGPSPGAPQTLYEVSPLGEVLKSWNFSELGLVNSIKGTALCDGASTPHRLLVWPTEPAVNPSCLFIYDLQRKPIRKWSVLDTTFGLQATLLSSAEDRLVAVAPGPLHGYPALVSVYSLSGELQKRLAPYEEKEPFGATLGSIDVDRDKVDELVMGSGVGPGQPATVRIVRLDGTIVTSWQAYGRGSREPPTGNRGEAELK